jgi:hypothetical protein
LAPTCDCPDALSRPHLTCKHICFLVLRVLRQDVADIGIPVTRTVFQNLALQAGVVNQGLSEQYWKQEAAQGKAAAPKNNEECTICFDGFDQDSDAACCQQCGYRTHRGCIKRWVHCHAKEPSCPLCRFPLEDARPRKYRKVTAPASVDTQHRFLDHAKHGRWDSVFSMLDAQPDLVNCCPSGRWTALHQAHFVGTVEVVRKLEERGAVEQASTSQIKI